jgi:NAD(P)-dependent dehydrogenase (short-subunit alcohol dehydrogenase family)
MYSRLEWVLHGVFGLIVYAVVWPIVWAVRVLTLQAQDRTSLAGRIAVVTGANCGVGRDTALQLARLGASVVLACRDVNRGQEAKLAIMNELSGVENVADKIHVVRLDLSNLNSIEEFISNFKTKFTRLDVLVNNAGLNTSGVTNDGLQQLFATNYLGHFELFRKLEPFLQSYDSSNTLETPPSSSRVVNLSSVMHHIGGSQFKESAYYGTPSEISESAPDCYADSKLYMNYLTLEINRRYRKSATSRLRPITAVSVNPGAVRSDIWRAVPWPISVVYNWFMHLVYLSTKQGSAVSVMASTVSDETLFETAGTADELTLLQSDASKSGGKQCGHPLLPYAVPYRSCLFGSTTNQRGTPVGLVRYGSFWILALECLSVFTGPQWARASLPRNALVKARELWEYSEAMVDSIKSAKAILK